MKTEFEKIQFDPTNHTYTLDGQRLRNVTGLVSSLKKPFDADYWAKRKAQERGCTVEEILAEWDENKRISLAKGTRLHQHIESALAGVVQDDPFLALNDRIPEMDAFDDLWDNLVDLVKVHSTERVIGDGVLGIAGTVDAVFFNRHTDTFHVWDWKTGKKFETASKWNRLNPPFNDLDECELTSYSIQASLYRLILDRNTDLHLGDSYVVYFSPQGVYTIHKALDLRERVLAWLTTADCPNG